MSFFGEDGLRPDPDTEDNGRRTVVVCFTNRCGSNLLGEIIATNKAFGRAGEYLSSSSVIKRVIVKQHKALAHYLQWLYNKKASADNIFAIKLGYRQLFFLTRAGLMPRAFGDVRFIHIWRRDVLQQAVSHAIATQTKAWTSKQTQKLNDNEINFRLAHIIRLMDGIHRANAKFRTFFSLYGIRPVEVIYEDLAQNLQTEGDRILREIGFAGTSATVRPGLITLRKQSSTLNNDFVRRMRQHYSLYRKGDTVSEQSDGEKL